MNIFIAPFVNALFGLYYLVGNLGWAIIIVTILIRFVLIPLVVPSLKSAKRMRDLQPKLSKLKEKYAGDKQGMAKAQMELYKQEGINPLSGCLPQILQIAVLLIFFAAFNMVVNYSMSKQDLADCKSNLVDNKCYLVGCKTNTDKKCILDTVEGYSAKVEGDFISINKNLISSFQMKIDDEMKTTYLGNNLLNTPAKVFKEKGINNLMILPIFLLLGSGILQYFSAKLMMPAPKIDEKIVKVTKDKEDDMMSMMRTQSMYMMPLMTIVIGWNFSLGLLLYWFVNSAFMIGQQMVMNKNTK